MSAWSSKTAPLVAMAQPLKFEEEAKYTPASKEAVAHFAQAVGIKTLPAWSGQE